MEYTLYNKMKNIIKNNIKYLTSFQIGGDVSAIVASLLTNHTNYTGMKENIDKYIDRLKKLEEMINGISNNGMKVIAERLQPSGNDKNIENIFDLKNKFGDFIKKYKDFLEQNIWNADRLTLDKEATDDNDPNKYDIFYNIDKDKKYSDQMDDFKKKLLIVFDPYIIDKQRSLKENIALNITQIDKIITISREFNTYIQEKKQEINKLFIINYNLEGLKFIKKTDIQQNEPELIKFSNLKLDPSGSLNISSIKNIEANIATITESIDVINEFNKIGEINIFKSVGSLNELLDVDDVVILKTAQKGGDKETVDKIFGEKFNESVADMSKKIEYLFELLDGIFNNFDYMKELQYRHNFYLAYLFLIIRNSPKNLDMEFYQYLSKDKINLYLTIFTNIKMAFGSMANINTTKELEFLNVYHYLTVNKLYELMNFINNNFPSENEMVDINECSGDIHTDLIMFNHFRYIILKLSKTTNGKAILNINDDQISLL
jgi:hypothetical protein